MVSLKEQKLADVARAEADDREDLLRIASQATTIQFDQTNGRPCNVRNSQIEGLLKISKSRLVSADSDLLKDLSRIHEIVKYKVGGNMVSWAGVGEDTSRLRAFGFLGKSARLQLIEYGVKLHAPEKTGMDAKEDELANEKAICILHRDRERLPDFLREENNRTISPFSVAQRLSSVISVPNVHVHPDHLVAYQPNLHNGASHLAAHLDAPLHEGFGKVIVTVAIRGSATIILIGKDEDREVYWKFPLDEGDTYVLSKNVRNMCLHAVLGEASGVRESLNLRFGIHTVKEAEDEILSHWKDAW